MRFWSDVTVEPKLSFRWWASFGRHPNEVSRYALRSFQKPSFEVAQSEYLNINDVAYRPGILSWNAIEIMITDMENPGENNTNKLYNMIKESGYNTDRKGDEPQSAIEKAKAHAALGGQIMFSQINADGDILEGWNLINPFITAVNFGQANYGAEEIMTISLTLRYDYAKYTMSS